MNREQRRHPPNGIQYPPGINPMQAAIPQQQGPVFNVGPLMLLDQLICLTAAHCPGPPAEAVARACEIVAQATKHVGLNTIGKRLAELQAAHNAEISG